MAKGFAATSLSEVATAAGVTKSLIHHHFGSKVALWQAVKVELFAGYHALQMAMLREQRGGDVGLLQRSMFAYFAFLAHHPHALRLKSWMYLGNDFEGPCDTMAEELFRLGVERISEGQRSGEVRADVPAPFILLSFLSLCEGWFTAQMRRMGDGFFDAAASAAAGIAAAPAPDGGRARVSVDPAVAAASEADAALAHSLGLAPIDAAYLRSAWALFESGCLPPASAPSLPAHRTHGPGGRRMSARSPRGFE